MEQNDKQEILDAIGIFSNAVDKQFENLEIKVISLEEDFKTFRKESHAMHETIDRLFRRIDDFIAKLERQEIENLALRVGLERAEARITALEQKLQMA